MQLVQGPSASTAADAFYTIGLNVDNCYRMYVESGNLIVQSKIGGVKGTVLTIAYNATSHAFWRIRHDAGRDRSPVMRSGAFVTTRDGTGVFEAAPASGGEPGTWV
jgi:hypothetical protein